MAHLFVAATSYKGKSERKKQEKKTNPLVDSHRSSPTANQMLFSPRRLRLSGRTPPTVLTYWYSFLVVVVVDVAVVSPPSPEVSPSSCSPTVRGHKLQTNGRADYRSGA